MRLLIRRAKLLLYPLLLIPACALAQTFSTSFETSNTGTFSIGQPPLTASFVGGSSKTIGNSAYYHSGLFSWHVPSGGMASVNFNTPVDRVDFWLRDTAGASTSNYRIVDSGNSIIASGNGSQSFVNVIVSRSGSQTRIDRIEFTSNGGGDTVVDDFSYSATQPFSPVNPISASVATGSVLIELEEVFTGLVAPVWASSAPGDSNHLYIVDQVGKIIRLNLDNNSSTELLDVSARLVSLGAFGPMSFDERGLLGLAFHPGYQGNGLLYTFSSEPVNGTADFTTLSGAETANHQAVIAEWQVNNPSAANPTAATGSRRELLRIDEPQFNHNGGHLAFGPDGLLYISLGDGGNADDEGTGHGANGNGRDASTILGTVLRINPRGNTASNGQYGIPTDNPLIGMSPVSEIYAYGFRNPYRFSFDRDNGNLWLADVGQGSIEEINRVNAGKNYGWNYKEGSFFFEGNGNNAGTVTDTDPGVPAGLVDPVAEYDHDEGSAIIGGFVYRGAVINQLTGRYLFADFGNGMGSAGRLFYLGNNNSILAFDVGNNTRLPLDILGFGQDAQGEIYVLTNTTGTPFGNTGTVLKIVPASVQPSGGSGSSGGGSGCFVATVFWGDFDAPAVKQLRLFRDKILANSEWGRGFIRWYYREGPAIADWFNDKPLLQTLGRLALYPLVLVAAATSGGSIMAQGAIALGAGVLLLLAYRRKRETGAGH